jgi:hypothetical protein
MRYLVQLFTLLIFTFVAPVFAGESESGSHHGYGHYGPHHLSLIVGNTHVRGGSDNFTLGLDYEYRLTRLLGVGAVAERAYGSLDATTVLAVADVHFTNALIMQVGPGFEHKGDEDVFVGRIGMLYEFEMDQFTLSPQLHWDYHDGEKNTAVAGVAVGFSF